MPGRPTFEREDLGSEVHRVVRIANRFAGIRLQERNVDLRDPGSEFFQRCGIFTP